MTKLLKWTFQYRLHVALLAGLLTLTPFAINDSESLAPFGILAGVSIALMMAAIYLSNKATDLAEDTVNTAALAIPQNLSKLVTGIAAICFILPLIWLWLYPLLLAGYIAIGGGLGYMYNYGIRYKGKKFRLKEQLYLKNASSAVIWSVCTSLPYYCIATDAHSGVFLSQLISVFVLVMCIEVFWDIRDVEGDLATGAKTFPNTFGIFKAKSATLAFIGVYMLWSYTLMMPSPILFMGHVITALLIAFATPQRPYFYFQSVVMLWIVISLLGVLT